MKLACNIDQRGRNARLIGGAIVTGVITGSKTVLVAGIFLDVAGLFMIFEGARSWCALRAIGIKTPM